MNLQRGDIGLARFPHAAGGRGKRRPVVVVQSDVYNQTRRHAVVVEITKNLTIANDPSSLLIDVSTPDGRSTGLTQNSVATCLHMVTMTEDRITRIIGKLAPAHLQKLNDCLKVALAIS